jgi:hypothetical protein
VRRTLVALLVAAGGAGVLLSLQPGPARVPDRPAPDARVNPPDPPPVADPERWRAAFPLTKAEIHEGEDTPGARALARALEPYRRGEYQQAASALEGVWLDHPGEHRAALYLGVSRLFLDEVPAAIEVLQMAQASPNPAVTADARWYALVGIARLRDPSDAEAGARALCTAGGPAKDRACRAVEALARPR